MDYKAHIGLVHTHAEGVSGRDDLEFAIEELALSLSSEFGAQPAAVAAAQDALGRDDLSNGLSQFFAAAKSGVFEG